MLFQWGRDDKSSTLGGFSYNFQPQLRMIEAPGSKETRLWEAERLFPWTKYRLTCGQMGKRFLTPVTEILFTSGKLTWYISTVANGNLEVPRVGWRMLKESLKEFLYICIYIYIYLLNSFHLWVQTTVFCKQSWNQSLDKYQTGRSSANA